MLEVVESLRLIALLSAFIGLVALMALSQRDAPGRSDRFRATLRNVILASTIVSVVSFVVYAFTPHEEVRSTVYGAGDRNP